MSQVCLDFFKYEWAEQGEQNTIYHNCIILKPFNGYQPGQHIDAISIFDNLYMWQGDEMVDDVTVVL